MKKHVKQSHSRSIWFVVAKAKFSKILAHDHYRLDQKLLNRPNMFYDLMTDSYQKPSNVLFAKILKVGNSNFRVLYKSSNSIQYIRCVHILLI